MTEGAGAVCVIGAGPGGIAAARWLASQGFEPEIFEACEGVGGQWRSANPMSGVWPDMRTNTSRVVTRFSDLDFPPETASFPHNREILAYLQRYADAAGLSDRIRTSTPVERLGRDPEGGWRVDWPGGSTRFERVVIASGRYNRPLVPDTPGLESFPGQVLHTFAYKDPEAFRGKRVLVAGGAISALEVASDLAMLGAEVTVASRRQRYVLPKLVAGVPGDNSRFSRYGALAAQTFAPEVNAARMKAWLLSASGDPSLHGALTPHEDIRQAGIALSQYFLPLVAEGRITTRPWIASVEGERVRFEDGAEQGFDAILFGTGFSLGLDYLSDEVRGVLDLDARHIDLSDATFHPDLEGMAFIGFYAQAGPYFPVLELQARLIAYAWSGAAPMPGRKALEAGIETYRKSRGLPQDRQMHLMALRFARLAGVEPDPLAWPELARALLFGPLTPVSFRLSGPDALPDAPAQVLEQAALLGAVRGTEFSEGERMLLAELIQTSADPQISRLRALL